MVAKDVRSPVCRIAPRSGPSPYVAAGLQTRRFHELSGCHRVRVTACGGYCHATTEGEATDAPDLFDCEWWHGDTDTDLFGVIRDGVPDTRMQKFGGILADDDIWRLVTVIRADSR